MKYMILDCDCDTCQTSTLTDDERIEILRNALIEVELIVDDMAEFAPKKSSKGMKVIRNALLLTKTECGK